MDRMRRRAAVAAGWRGREFVEGSHDDVGELVPQGPDSRGVARLDAALQLEQPFAEGCEDGPLSLDLVDQRSPQVGFPSPQFAPHVPVRQAELLRRTTDRSATAQGLEQGEQRVMDRIRPARPVVTGRPQAVAQANLERKRGDRGTHMELLQAEAASRLRSGTRRGRPGRHGTRKQGRREGVWAPPVHVRRRRWPHFGRTALRVASCRSPVAPGAGVERR
jgi:hypothetical protein